MVKKKSKKQIKKTSSPTLKESAAVLLETEKVKKTKIRVIGIGGGGGNIVSELISKVEKATFVVTNTDRQALREASRKALKLQFGESLTRGLGTGMNPELGEQAAFEAKDKIKNLLKGQDLVILIATLGGGAGSGAAPVFAKISKSLGNITYGIFTLPFKFEGEKKMEIAREAFEKLRPHLNGLSIIPNELIFKIIDKATPLTKALSIINKNLADNLEGLIETIYQPGLINIDFADFKTIFSGRGRLTYLNTVELEKTKGIEEVIKKLSFSPLYPYTIRGAKGILFNITGGKDLSLAEVSQISKNIFGTVNKEAKIIFGISQSQKEADKIKVSLLANGCQVKIFPSEYKKIKTKAVIKKPKRKRKKKKYKLSKIEKKTKAPKKKRKKPKTKKTSVKIKKEKDIRPKEAENEINGASLLIPEEKIEIKVRRNALQVKEGDKEVEREIIEKENFWEPPAFLRRKKE